MIETNTCPCCGRHCDLSAPHCERGEEYKRTGVIPERENDSSGGHGEHGYHGHNSREYGEALEHHGKQKYGSEEEDGRQEGHGWHGGHGKGHGRGKSSRCHEKEIENRSGDGGDVVNDQEKRIQYRQEHYEHADINDKLVINLRELGHMIRFRFEGKGSQERILMMLKEYGTMTQRVLTERLGIKPGSASEVLSKLEKSGLISRTPNGEDRRVVDIALTEEGDVQAQEAVVQRDERRAEMFSNLTEEEKDSLLGLLERINSDWAKYSEERKCHGHGGHHEHSDQEGYGHKGHHEHGDQEGHGHGRHHEHGKRQNRGGYDNQEHLHQSHELRKEDDL